MQRLLDITLRAGSVLLLVGLAVGWIQLFSVLLSSFRVDNLWVWVFGLPLWLLLPFVGVYLWGERGTRRELDALDALAASGAPEALAVACELGRRLTVVGDWRRFRERVLPLLRRLTPPERAPLLDDIEATLGKMASFSMPGKPGSVMNSPSDAWPLMDLEHHVRDRLEALRAPPPTEDPR